MAEEAEVETFSFEGEFQTAIVALLARDPDFCLRTDGLIKPDYFVDGMEAAIAAMFTDYFRRYKTVPKSKATLSEMIKDGVKSKMLRKELVPDLPPKLKELSEVEIKDRDFVIDKVVEFARHQELKKAILDSVEWLEKGRYPDIEKAVKKAMEVGAADHSKAYVFYDLVKDRTAERKAVIAGGVPKRGITTGLAPLDDILYHGGWGRQELAIFMGGPKSGKTTALIDSARAASFAGHSVLYVTLEVAAKIVAERLDANIAEFGIKTLGLNADEVERRIDAAKASAGPIYIHEFPSGTLQPRGLSRLINHYKSHGQKFDLVIVDYADLMAPNFRTDDPRENSRTIYVDLRAIMQQEDVAGLSATQTNREGTKQAVQRMEHVGEDFNKIRTSDLVISINATEDEKAEGEARLYFVASRNQEDGVCLRVKTALERGKLIAGFIGRE